MVNANSNLHILYQKEDKKEVNGLYQEYRRQWHNNLAEFKVSDFPLFLDVEATSLCNLKCPHCVQTHANFEKGFMDFGMYKDIIDEASENQCYGVKFHSIGRGEPLLHQRLPEMVAYAVKNGLIDVYLNTNAVLLNKEKSKRLLDAGLHRISFSIDHYIPHLYEKLRVGTTLKKVIRNVDEFFDQRENGNYNTEIRIQTVRLPNLDLKQYTEFWYPFCDEVAVIGYKEMSKREYGLKGSWICPQPWQRFSILWNGSGNICNHDDRGHAILGNVYDMSIHKMWHSIGANYIREAFKKGTDHLISACNGCYLRSSCIKNEKESR